MPRLHENERFQIILQLPLALASLTSLGSLTSIEIHFLTLRQRYKGSGSVRDRTGRPRVTTVCQYRFIRHVC